MQSNNKVLLLLLHQIIIPFTAEYTCQGVTGSGQFSQVDWTFHVVSSVDGSSQMCLRLYVTDALIVLWQSPPGKRERCHFIKYDLR